MKKNFKVVLFSCLIGTVLAGLFFLNIKEKAEAKNKVTLYAYQVGVFKSKENANNFRNNYTYAKVVKDAEYYRVFIGITVENKEILTSIFDEEGFTYYIKEIEVNADTLAEVKKYDELLRKTSEESKFLVIKNCLESIPDEL